MNGMNIEKSKKVKLLLSLILIVSNLAVICAAKLDVSKTYTVSYNLSSQQNDTYQVFYSDDMNWSEECSKSIGYETPNQVKEFQYIIPKKISYLRLDLGTKENQVSISDINIKYLGKTVSVEPTFIVDAIKDSEVEINEISNYQITDDQLEITSSGGDPYMILEISKLGLEPLNKIDDVINWIWRIFVCLLIDCGWVIVWHKYNRISELVLELNQNKKLIWQLSKNDFKTKYAGSYLGITWAFVQPVVTVMVYWFVFQVGFKSAPIEDFPFVLWLIAGIVPWFFFSEAIINATNSLIEYSYLVKKVVFKISILPIVKILSSLFVHGFFVLFGIIVFSAYGYVPTPYTFQVIYYTLCTFVLVLGVSYVTSAIVIFFRDLGQIINIFMQVGMWVTPIMWDYMMMPEPYRWILKINPMYYIVQGYRDALINRVWFWNRPIETVYFWTVSAVVAGIGCLVFKRLKIHFADVL